MAGSDKTLLYLGGGLVGLSVLTSTRRKTLGEMELQALNTAAESHKVGTGAPGTTGQVVGTWAHLSYAMRWGVGEEYGYFDRRDPATGTGIPQTSFYVADRIIHWWADSPVGDYITTGQRSNPAGAVGGALDAIVGDVFGLLSWIRGDSETDGELNTTNPWNELVSRVEELRRMVYARYHSSRDVTAAFDLAELDAAGALTFEESLYFWRSIHTVAHELMATEAFPPDEWAIAKSELYDAVRDMPGQFVEWTVKAAAVAADAAGRVGGGVVGGLLNGLLSSPTFMVGAGILGYHYLRKKG